MWFRYLVRTVNGNIDRPVEDGPSIHRSTDGLENHGRWRNVPALKGLFEYRAVLLDRLGRAIVLGLAIVVLDFPPKITVLHCLENIELRSNGLPIIWEECKGSWTVEWEKV